MNSIKQRSMEATTDSTSPVRVNVSLCGSISRKDIAFAIEARGSHRPLKSITSSEINASFLPPSSSSGNTNHTFQIYEGLLGIVSQNPSLARIAHNEKQTRKHQLQQPQPSAPLYEPPSWAVPARGEARLEPVCEAVGRQQSVDLTSKSCFRIGRSPNSDIQLMHVTSSRRHALLFHHSNGSCYVVDCGSGHGTYVNGMRISSPPRGGIVIPYRVRRGAMIRFGGPGAPSFVLKSFSSNMKEMTEPVAQPTDSPRCADTGDVVRLNTRINALGDLSADSIRLSVLDMTSEKRSAENIFGSCTSVFEPCVKRMRCSSPPLSPEEPIRLVSPDSQYSGAKRRVTFSSDPPSTFYPALVTPDNLSEQEDNNFII